MIPVLDQRMLTVYCSLFSALYQHQQGALRHGPSFSMHRAVKQTDDDIVLVFDLANCFDHASICLIFNDATTRCFIRDMVPV